MAGLRIAVAALLIALNTVVHCLPLFLVAALKALLPLPRLRHRLSGALVWIAERWIVVNGLVFALLTRIDWQLSGLDGLDRRQSYLVLCNHQSWVDIPVLQQVLIGRVPFLRFFLKQQLIWVPLLGLAWWALDFPFMKRYSKAQLARNPALRGSDIVATRRACERFRGIPVAVMNFVEGTRFTAAKHAGQHSPFRHLLKPKSGGVAFALDAMGEALSQVLDVTIGYPDGRPTLLDLMAGRVKRIRVDLRRREVPAELRAGDYESDAVYRARFHAWMQSLWEDKDALLERWSQADRG